MVSYAAFGRMVLRDVEISILFFEVLSMKRDNWVGFVPFYLLVAILSIAIAKGGSDAISAISDHQVVVREHCIVIDAGHGGIDGGATSCTGVLESHINLEIALRLNDMMHLLGYDTVMIRTTDTSIHTGGNSIAAQKLSDLRERVRIASETEGALLISLHQNTYHDSKFSGAQVFYSANPDSKQLAILLQQSLISTVNPGSNRKAKKAEGIYLMQHTICPAVLVECGFLTNPQEEANLRSAEYQKRLCSVISTCLSNFLKR